MAKKLPWFPFWVDDFLADENVLVMSNEEVGIYVKLLCHQWKEGSIPAMLLPMAKLCGTNGDEMAGHWQQVSKCFREVVDNPDRLVNPRLELEREQQRTLRKARSDAGLLGAEAKWRPHGKAKVLPMTKNGKPESEPESELESKLPTTTAPPNGGTPTELVEPTTAVVVTAPKPPAENAAPAQRLSWHIKEGRWALYEDQHYDPWKAKFLGICKTIINDDALGDWDEVIRRLRVLFIKCASAPEGNDYYRFTVENFKKRWPELVGEPKLKIEKQSKATKAHHAYLERIAILQAEIAREGGENAET